MRVLTVMLLSICDSEESNELAYSVPHQNIYGLTVLLFG